ncbi:hypothetical protein K458DRAFT_486381 [Lentithecium fluviatile CBS 122367]|uniref:DUF7703 domain-containing protein n=1 Tax=Lentithecium fluviatile CBS 122367 TaxID=1168545 RepID=A0A6G1J8A7_9PLEO|nr:hypothetical protein K458DRAFT_486381 [Lentithecium fluviatile CBS 122367]
MSPAFTALPIYTTIELTACIFYTFRRYTGLYFYSVLATTWGVTIHAIGFILKFCVPECNWILATVLAEIGWVGMVTGFGVVLSSRMGLLVRSWRVRRWALIMIIVDAFLFHVPTIVFQFGVSNGPTHKKYLPYMAPMERIQVAAFTIQEVTLSAIYIYATLQYLRTSLQKSTRRTIVLLVGIQIAVILLDVIIIDLDYCEFFTLKAVIHSFVYAVKLQLEFVILNDVKAMARRGVLAPSTLLTVRLTGRSSETGNNVPSLPAKPSGKKWWPSRPVLPSLPMVSAFSTTEILRPAADVEGYAEGYAGSAGSGTTVGRRSGSQTSKGSEETEKVGSSRMSSHR